MMSFSKLTKGIIYQFARRIKGTKGLDTIAKPENLQAIEKNSIQPTNQDIKELQQQFEFLSEKNLQPHKQKIKAEIFKQLAYEGEDPSPNKLVNRPAKGVVWGLGGQLVLANRKVQLQGVRDDVEEIVKFLQLNQVKNIYIQDWAKYEEQTLNRKRYSIIGSCFSARHCWKTAIELKNAFNKHMLHKKRNKINKKVDLIGALMVGKKDQQWTMVQYKDFEVSLMTQQQRQAADLQWKWNNPVSEDVVDKHSRLDNDKKRRRGQFQDFD